MTTVLERPETTGEATVNGIPQSTLAHLLMPPCAASDGREMLELHTHLQQDGLTAADLAKACSGAEHLLRHAGRPRAAGETERQSFYDWQVQIKPNHKNSLRWQGINLFRELGDSFQAEAGCTPESRPVHEGQEAYTTGAA